MEQKKEHQKLYAENIKYKDKLKQQQDHDQQVTEKEVYEKQHKRVKWYIRRLKKTKLKKYHYYSESETESEPEIYYNYGYDKSDGKTLPPKKKIKTGRRKLVEEENNDETEEEEEEHESKSENNNRKIRRHTKQNKHLPIKKHTT